MDKGAGEMRPYYGPGQDGNAGNTEDADDVMSLSANIDDIDAARVDADIDADVQPVLSSAIYVPHIPDPGVEADIDMVDTGGPSTPVLSGELVGVSASDDPDEIRVGIEHTRTEMTGTINAIQEKLNPSVLMDQAKSTLHDATADILEQAKGTLHEATTDILDNAKDTVREATVGRVENMVSNAADTAKSTGSSVVELIKQNPIPAAVVGLGLGWLLTRNRGASPGNPGMYGPHVYGYGPHGYGYGYGQQGYGAGISGQPENMVDQVVDGIKQNPLPAALAGAGIGWWLLNRQGTTGTSHSPGNIYGGYYSPYTPGSTQSQGGAKDVMGRVQDKVGDVAGQAGDTASDVVGKVGEVVGQAGEVAGSVAGQVGQAAGNVAGAVGQTAGNVASGTGDIAGNLLRTIRENPIPAAIAGASLAWLLTSKNSSAQKTLRYAGNVAGNVSSTAGEAVGSAAGAAGDTVSNITGAAGDAVGTVASTVKEQGQQAQSQLHRLLLDNPLAVGAAAVAIGAVVGLAVPETPQEHQLMGQARDALFEKAQTVAQDTLGKVQQVTQEAGNAIQQEAEYQGLV
jgi:uncharacterized protein YjbJ (UPF0337 family)